MTREDINRIATEYLNDTESEFEMQDVIELAYKAVSIIEALHEIRDELTKNYVDPYNRNTFRYTTVSLLKVLDLIDKHIAEINDKEEGSE